MNLNIRITWAAGAGVNSTVDIIADIFANLGYDLITDIEYESRIKWWVNFFDISLSDNGEKFLTNKVDIILALNAESFKKQISSLKKWATIIINDKWLSKLENIDLSDYKILNLDIKDKYDNTYLIWILAKYLNLDLNVILNKIELVLSKKWKEVVKNNQNIVKNIYDT
jgi:2-oxoglutarate ferredoxin oxidoreductase subunit alpha